MNVVSQENRYSILNNRETQSEESEELSRQVSIKELFFPYVDMYKCFAIRKQNEILRPYLSGNILVMLILVINSTASRSLSGESEVLVDHEFSNTRVTSSKDGETNDGG